MPQLRQNIITGEWVVIAPARSKRPNDYAKAEWREIISDKKTCVFCPTGSEYQRRFKELDNKHSWVIANKYPAFVCDPAQCSTRSYYPESSFYRAKDAVGEHDVVVIKDHDLPMPKFTLPIWQDLFETIEIRMIEHCRNHVVEQIMPIYNYKAEAGASISHPHAQIFSGPVIPNSINKELDGAKRYFENNGFCVFCDLVNHEKKEKIRLIAENQSFIAFTFYAARFPFEIWIMPKVHHSTFESTGGRDRKLLAEIMQLAIQKLAKLLNDPPLNWWIHSLPTVETHSDYYHWHLEIAPRITGYGGFELGSGMVIDVEDPEESAEYLRKTRI